MITTHSTHIGEYISSQEMLCVRDNL